MSRLVNVKYRNYSDNVSYETVIEVAADAVSLEIEETAARYASECAGEPALVEEWTETDETDPQWILSDLTD